MEEWVREGMVRAQQKSLCEVTLTQSHDEEVVVAAGDEFERQHCGEVNGERLPWTERVLVVKSFNHAVQQERGFEKR